MSTPERTASQQPPEDWVKFKLGSRFPYINPTSLVAKKLISASFDVEYMDGVMRKTNPNTDLYESRRTAERAAESRRDMIHIMLVAAHSSLDGKPAFEPESDELLATINGICRQTDKFLDSYTDGAKYAEQQIAALQPLKYEMATLFRVEPDFYLGGSRPAQ